MRMQSNRRTKAAVLVGVVGVAGLTLSACGASGPTSAKANRPAELSSATGPNNCTGPTVTATGSGTINVAPDELSVTLGVHTQAASAATALRDNNARARALIATLKAAGLSNSDIQTTGLSIYPTYSRPKGKPATINGYQVNNTVTVEVHKLSSAGTLIDRAVAQVGQAVRLDGISFSLQKPNPAEATAHTQAVHAAISQAQSMATAAGTTLGPLCSVTDVGNGYNDYASASAAGGSSNGAGSPVPIEAGSQQVNAQVRVVYSVAG